MAEAILPQQGDLIGHVRAIDPRIKYLIRLMGRHELSKRNGGVFFTGSPEYSFTDERGIYILYEDLAISLTALRLQEISDHDYWQNQHPQC